MRSAVKQPVVAFAALPPSPQPSSPAAAAGRCGRRWWAYLGGSAERKSISESILQVRTSARAAAPAEEARAPEKAVPGRAASAHVTGLSLVDLLRQLEALSVERSTRSLNVEVSKAARNGNYPAVVRSIQRAVLTESQLDVQAFTSLVDMFGKRNQYYFAVKAFRTMISAGLTPNQISWNALIHAAAQSHQPRHLRQTLREMKSAGLRGNQVTFGIVIHAVVQAKDWVEAERLLSEEPLAVSTYSFTSLIVGYVRFGMIDDALRVEQEMRAQDVKLSVLTYTTLIRGLGKAHRADHVQRLYKQAVESVLPGNQDSRFFESTIAAFAKSGDVEKAFRVFQDMRLCQVEPTILTHNSLIHVCGHTGNVGRAFIVYKFVQSTESNLVPNAGTYIGLANAVLRASTRDERTVYVIQKLKEFEAAHPRAGAKLRALERIMATSD